MRNTQTKTSLIKVNQHHQITIPKNLREKYQICGGDYVEVEETKNNDLIIKPVKIIHPDQAYFYTEEWQKGEKEADRDIKNNNFAGSFDDTDEMFKVLDK